MLARHCLQGRRRRRPPPPTGATRPEEEGEEDADWPSAIVQSMQLQPHTAGRNKLRLPPPLSIHIRRGERVGVGRGGGGNQ